MHSITKSFLILVFLSLSFQISPLKGGDGSLPLKFSGQLQNASKEKILIRLKEINAEDTSMELIENDSHQEKWNVTGTIQVGTNNFLVKNASVDFSESKMDITGQTSDGKLSIKLNSQFSENDAGQFELSGNLIKKEKLKESKNLFKAVGE